MSKQNFKVENFNSSTGKTVEKFIETPALKEEKVFMVEKKYNFRLVVNNPFGSFKTKGQLILTDEEIQSVIDSGNLRNCLKTLL